MKLCCACGYTTHDEMDLCPDCLAKGCKVKLFTERECEKYVRWLYQCGTSITDGKSRIANILRWLGYERLPGPAVPEWQKPTPEGPKAFYF